MSLELWPLFLLVPVVVVVVGHAAFAAIAYALRQD